MACHLANLYLRQVRNEIAVLKRVSMGHQNILTLVDYFETMNNRGWKHILKLFGSNLLQYTSSQTSRSVESSLTEYAERDPTTSPMPPI